MQDGGSGHFENLKNCNISATKKRFWRYLVQWCVLPLRTPSANKILQIQQFKIAAAAAILKSRKILISLQPIDRFWQYLACWCVSTLSTPIANKISRFQKSKTAAAAIWKFAKKRNISATEWQFITKFGTVMGPNLQTASAIIISRIRQSKMVAAAILKKRKILIPSQSIDRF